MSLGGWLHHTVSFVNFTSAVSKNGSDGTQCQRNVDFKNDTSGKVNNVDGGIPASLELNIVVWTALILLFCCINGWLRRQSKQGLLASNRRSSPDITAKTSSTNRDVEESVEFPEEQDGDTTVGEGFYAWLPALFKLRDEEIRSRCGEDAIHYLSMERHLLFILCIFTVVSIGILLPVNYTASTHLKSSGFARTTVANLPANSGLYWLHAIVALAYLAVIFVVMWRFSKRLRRFSVTGHISKHTLLVGNISKGCTADDIRQHIQEAYEDCEVVDIQVVYDVSKLTKLDEKRIDALENQERYEAILDESGKRPILEMHLFVQRDAISHYQKEKKRLCAACVAERELVLVEKDLQCAFVTLSSLVVAQRFYDDYLILRTNVRPNTSVSDEVGASFWTVTKTSVPDNIRWENLHIGKTEWWIRFTVINGALFVFLFFFTTPAIIMSSLPKLKRTLKLDLPSSAADNDVFTVYLPTLTLFVIASLLPLIVSFSCYLEAHWYRSSQDRFMVRKTYAYLVLVIVVLPGLGLTSLDAVASLVGNEALPQQLECIFLPSGGGFFINYVILSAFIGTAVELCRIPILICFLWKLCRAKSKRDRTAAYKATVVPFKYGIEYAWILTLFALCITFSTVCPLIVPFGVVYFFMKYWVDKYNLCFATLPPKFYGTTRIHHTAVNFAFSAGIMLQFVILFFSVVRSGSAADPNEIFSIIVIILILAACIANACFGVFKNCTASQRGLKGDNTYQASEDLQEDAYKAPILKKSFECDETSPSSPRSLNRKYNTFDETNHSVSPGDDKSL